MDLCLERTRTVATSFYRNFVPLVIVIATLHLMHSVDWCCETVRHTALSSNTTTKEESYAVISRGSLAATESLKMPKILSLKSRVSTFKLKFLSMIHIQMCTMLMLIDSSKRQANSVSMGS